MGTEVRGVSEAAPLGRETASIGAYLRSQRQLRGVGLAELEAVTRIPRRSLERLEAGEFDGNPDGFARGFVRAVAGALGLDPDETVARMLSEPLPEAGPDPGPPVRALAVAGGILLALALGALLYALVVGRGSPDEALESQLVHRRDAVKALAEEARAGEAE